MAIRGPHFRLPVLLGLLWSALLAAGCGETPKPEETVRARLIGTWRTSPEASRLLTDEALSDHLKDGPRDWGTREREGTIRTLESEVSERAMTMVLRGDGQYTVTMARGDILTTGEWTLKALQGAPWPGRGDYLVVQQSVLGSVTYDPRRDLLITGGPWWRHALKRLP